MPDALAPFEDRDVLSAAIEIPNAAGGLREAMKFEPVEFHHDAEVYVVLRCRVAKVRFDPVKDSDGLKRIHVFDAQQASLVDGSIVKEHLEAQAERIAAVKRVSEGTLSIEDQILTDEHEAGKHAPERVDLCPVCREEIDAEEAEAWSESDE